MSEKTKYMWKLTLILTINLMLLVAVSAAHAKAERLGDSGERVAEIQHELRERNIIGGKANGIFDIETKRGIADFQSSAGIEKSGEADFETLSALGINTRCADCFSSQTELLARCIQLSGCLSYPEMLEKGTEILKKTGGSLTVGKYISQNYPVFLKKADTPSDDAYNAAVQVIKRNNFVIEK